MKNHPRKFNHETVHNQLIPVQYNVMCIDRAKVKIIYSGRFKENWYTDNTVKIVMIRKYIHLSITLILVHGICTYVVFPDFMLGNFCPEYLLYANICVLQRFGVHSVSS